MMSPAPNVESRAWLGRATFFVAGLAPIVCLSSALFGWLPLPWGARFIVLPTAMAAICMAFLSPYWGRRALIGWVAGFLATALYDVLRLTLVGFAVWPDFIPPIGRLALDDPNAHAVWGYLWRFLGNGGGMGMAFAMLPWWGVRAGMVYGLAICGGLFFTLYFAPGAQTTLFPLTGVTAAAAIAGHLDYGAALGFLVERWGRPAATPEEIVLASQG